MGCGFVIHLLRAARLQESDWSTAVKRIGLCIALWGRWKIRMTDRFTLLYLVPWMDGWMSSSFGKD